MSMRDWAWVLGGLVLAGAAGLAALPWLVQPLFRVVFWPRYRLVVRGLEHLPRTGPVVLALNHVTWIDGFLIAAACPRRGNALVNAGIIGRPVVRSLTRWIGLIPVPFTGPRALRAAIASAREVLDRGQLLALFPEAQLTRNGLLGRFYRGIETILHGREAVPVIPVYLDNLWGSAFSFSGGRFLWKRPRGWRRTVGIVFGPPIPPPITAFAVRQALLATGVRAFELRRGPSAPLETIDPTLPHLDHPTLGALTGSTPDFDRDDIHHIGQKPGTVGHPLPGVALRVVDESGRSLPPDAEGRLEALVAGRPEWEDTGYRAGIDADGFVRLAGGTSSPPPGDGLEGCLKSANGVGDRSESPADQG